MPSHAFTIRKLADAVGVNTETVRYYQKRGLLDEPPREQGGFRAYDDTHVQRLQFIKRAQELGFSLDDVSELLTLSQHPDRRRLRKITETRVAEIRRRITQLESIATALEELSGCCEKTSMQQSCPIVAALIDQETE